MPTKPKTRVTQTWRVCTECWIYKWFSFFSKSRGTKIWYSTKCKECRNKKHKEHRKNEEIRKQEIEYKKKFRETEIWKIKAKLDDIYYKDKVIMNNRKIIKQIKTPDQLRKMARECKISYFISKGYDINFLNKIYEKKNTKQAI